MNGLVLTLFLNAVLDNTLSTNYSVLLKYLSFMQIRDEFTKFIPSLIVSFK